MASTLSDYLQSQQDLLAQAALALPHQFSRCTHALGPLRQAVYLCLTCPEHRGICSACSIACHTDHEQVELFPKRNFRCDCPTTALANQCTLHTKLEDENTTNTYGQNFKGVFCRCGRPYDAKTERETMIQCLVCEDWFHESCCNLRERPSSREPTPVATEPPQEDNASEASSSGLPPPLISGDDYESFVCAACAFSQDLIQKYAGTPGAVIVVRNSLTDPWQIERGVPPTEDDPIDVVQQQQPTTPPPSSPTATGSKRLHSPSPSEHSPGGNKRVKISCEAPICLAPAPNPIAAKIYTGGLEAALDSSRSLGTGDIFFIDGFRDRWCRCSTCLPLLQAQPYLLEEEDTYEPPEDPDSGLSLEELGMRALERIPRDRAIDGIHAFQEMRDDLIKFLRPFAQEGKVVNEADVRGFFESRQKK